MIAITKGRSSGSQAIANNFGFWYLPWKCQIHVFSYLTTREKGVASLVCSNWKNCIMSPVCWQHLDLRQLTSFNPQLPNGYYIIFDKLFSFICYIIKVQPILKSLKFTIEVDERSVLKVMNALYTFVDCSRLSQIYMHFIDRSGRDFHRTRVEDLQPGSVQWLESFQCQYLLERILHLSPSIQNMSIRWNWSFQSFNVIAEFKNLKQLEIRDVLIDGDPMERQQHIINQILSLPKLEKLILDIYFRTQSTNFCLSALNLTYLDLSRCILFGVSTVNLPKLRHIHISKVRRRPWIGPFDLGAEDRPCWYDVLKKGCPKLITINDHILQESWRTNIYESLNDLMTSSCCRCLRHESPLATDNVVIVNIEQNI